jgi:hypothetical protein
MTPDELRAIFAAASELQDARALALASSLGLVAVVLWLVWRGRLREEYTPIWLGLAAFLLVISFNLDWLMVLARVLGAWTPSSVIFFLGEAFLVVLCLNYAVRLSRAGTEIKNLAQELAVLRARLDEIESSDRSH